jgi:regulator of protease activity HflC (stomatin/prohibitin superfamily)
MNIFKKKVTSYRGETVYEWSPLRITFAAVAGVLIFILLLTCISSVPTGYTGILTTFGKVEDGTLDAGVHLKAPWQRIVKLDNRTQKVEITCQAFSADIQQVDLKMSINFCIDKTTAQNLYRTVGEKYYDTILYPRILENTKAVFAKYTAEDLIANRQALSAEIQDKLTGEASEYGIAVVNFNVEDIDFTDAFTNAVEAKQVAAQNKLTAETEQARLTMEQQAKAERRIIDANAAAEEAKIQAEADLEVTKIQADAAEYAGLKEAAKNKAISEWLTPELIRYYYILQWDGKLPQTMLGENANFMIPLAD